ncbi:MAG: glycosyltransferase [Proteobacteria bacterium]|nr:glycosyltransferase [Pseudomonadota bacterium]
MTLRIALLGAANSIHLQRWALALVGRGHAVCVLTQHALAEVDCERLPSAVEIIVLPHRGQAGYFMNARFARRFLVGWGPDILNAHYASGYATTARLVGYRPWLLSVWGSDVYDFPTKSPLHRALVRGNLRAADAVASTSHCMAEVTHALAPSLGQIAVTPFGVDMDAYADSVPMPQAQSGRWLVGTVKTMADKYGVDTLIQAFAVLLARLQASDPDMARQLRLRLVGDGPQMQALKQLAAQFGVAERVQFVGHVDHAQVPHELAQLDVYVALSRQESFGVAIIEAGAAARPVVVSDAGGLPEVVVDGVTGVVVPRENPQAAADAIERLLRDADLRQRMGAAAQLHVAQHYSWPACVATMLGVYERVIAQYRSSET